MVQDRIDGSMAITHKGRMLKFKEITERPVKEKEQPFTIRRRRPYTPPPDHPWRRSFKVGLHKYERGKPIEPKI
jgi:hypothetical protein